MKIMRVVIFHRAPDADNEHRVDAQISEIVGIFKSNKAN